MELAGSDEGQKKRFFSRVREKRCVRDGGAGANALGGECPPAPACGRRLLLYVAPKGIRTRLPACTAVPSSKRESGAFTASLRSTARRGRQAFGAKSRRRHSPQADAGGHLPRRPAGRAGPVRSRRGVRSAKKALPRTWVKNLFFGSSPGRGDWRFGQ